MLRKDDDRPARLTSCDGGLVKLRESEASNSRNGLGEWTPVIYLDQIVRTFTGIVSAQTCMCRVLYNLLCYPLINSLTNPLGKIVLLTKPCMTWDHERFPFQKLV